MQQVAEDNNLLGNIQTGFRKGRLGTENLFILETVIEKCKRNHEKLMIAMLDITKAYDRVDRDFLWHKLRQFRFPDKLVRILELLYSNTTCILKFQGLTSDPKRITLGLKQGCVMSPILFALYISDLGRLLEDSGLGINIRNITIPGLFFADDMLIWERESNFQKLLNIVRYYGQYWKIEFSEEKSIVIPMHRPPNNNKKWLIGTKPDQSQEVIAMAEHTQGKYLGVTLQRKYNIFKPHIKCMEKKINYATHNIAYLIRNVDNILPVLRDTWNTYVSSTVVYATEALAFSPSQIEILEKMQRKFYKMVLRLPRTTKSNNFYAITNTLPLSFTIFQRRLNFRQGVINKNHPWPINCLKIQTEWAVEDGFLDDQYNPVQMSNNRKKTIIFNERIK